jgi:NAD(P)-dependent dehydrogenase (short-subunit alcohol dehydrogenase family)
MSCSLKYCGIFTLIIFSLFLLFSPTAVITIQSTISNLFKNNEEKNHYSTIRNTFPLRNHRCLVTGTSRGLGKAIASELVGLGCYVYLAQRSGDENDVISVRENAFPYEESDGVEFGKNREEISQLIGNAEVVSLDLSDFTSIETAVSSFVSGGIEFDIVILNAAVVSSSLTFTQQHFESSFGVNYLGHFYFTQLLLTHNRLTSYNHTPPRFIFITSQMHQIASPLQAHELGCANEFSLLGSLDRYAHSKLCITTYAVELASRLSSHIDVYLYDPVSL